MTNHNNKILFKPPRQILSTVDLSYVETVKSTMEISQNFVAFSEYMNFTKNELTVFETITLDKSRRILFDP